MTRDARQGNITNMPPQASLESAHQLYHKLRKQRLRIVSSVQICSEYLDLTNGINKRAMVLDPFTPRKH
jgi:hypothetical protein